VGCLGGGGILGPPLGAPFGAFWLGGVGRVILQRLRAVSACFRRFCARPRRARHAGRTVPSSWPPAWTRYHAFAAPSQLSGDLQAKGPRLTREDVVVGIRRGPIALGEDVLDIDLRLPGLCDLRSPPAAQPPY